MSKPPTLPLFDDFVDDIWTDADEQYLSIAMTMGLTHAENDLAENDVSWLDYHGGTWQTPISSSDNLIDGQIHTNRLNIDESNYDEHTALIFGQTDDTWYEWTNHEHAEFQEDNEWFDNFGVDDTNDTWQFEINLPTVSDQLTLEERSKQIAIQTLIDFAWDKRYLPFLEILFKQPAYGATRLALYRAVERNFSPQQIILAHQIKLLWLENEHFHLSTNEYHGAWYAKYKWMSWPFALDLLKCFEGLPDIDEISVHLNELYEYWQIHVWIQNPNVPFIDFLYSQMQKPVEYWVSHQYDYLEKTEWITPYSKPQLSREYSAPDSLMAVLNHFYVDKMNHVTNDLLDYSENPDDLNDLEEASHSSKDEVPTTHNQPIQSIWEQHQQIMRQGIHQGLKAYEILQLIPLNHELWLPEMQTFFQDNEIDNVHAALKVLLHLSDPILRQHTKQMIQQYIDEVKNKERNMSYDEIG